MGISHSSHHHAPSSVHIISFCPPPSLALTPSFLLQSTLFLGLTASIFSWPTIYIGTRNQERTYSEKAWCVALFILPYIPVSSPIFGLIRCARIDWTLRISHLCVHYLCLPERLAMRDGFSANSILPNLATAVETARQWLGSSVWNQVNLPVVVLSRRAGVRSKDKPESQDRRSTR
jgi:hypothetical protein